MGKGRIFQAAKVYQLASEAAATNMVAGLAPRNPPLWLKALEAIPPAEINTRPYPIQHSPPNPRARKPRNLWRPTKIVYPEDELRRDFYRDHPWELARPRMIIELDGKDARYFKWGKGLRQPGMPLCGESVVQRQMWLMNNEKLSKQEAYDKARHEFYKLRQLEQMERRIAVEEARMVGGYFGKDLLHVGMELENKSYENWKKWATAEIARYDAQRASAYSNVVDNSALESAEEDELLAQS
ncbi:mitochondrial ribosomal protein S25 [Sordaria brevicollis]|uniref:37S ribosomal protein S25, mitochondrial n=1 Tax=Sordaria brevicollis TaxID=83679 RepID=A0AAE0U671_SORBR|nr:mitochondrial ribosomal protein S25 [Sordaria brevicollis]